MPATAIFLSRQDAKALAAVLADAVTNRKAPMDNEAARRALTEVGSAVEREAAFASADLTESERRAAGRCWEALAFDRPDIGDGQFERIRRRLIS